LTINSHVNGVSFQRRTTAITECERKSLPSIGGISSTSVDRIVIWRSGVCSGQKMIAEATNHSIQVASRSGKYPHLTSSMSESGIFRPRRIMIIIVRIQNATDAIATRLKTKPPSRSMVDRINKGSCWTRVKMIASRHVPTETIASGDVELGVKQKLRCFVLADSAGLAFSAWYGLFINAQAR
jgi:hypothetical protein